MEIPAKDIILMRMLERRVGFVEGDLAIYGTMTLTGFKLEIPFLFRFSP
jgi:hypothetical protein